MRTLGVFAHVSLDGYFVDAFDDMSWAHKGDPEWAAFSSENAKNGGALLLGRVTYQQMASFWPTRQARTVSPVVAERMNTMPKVVFSRTLSPEGLWQNTRLVATDIASATRALKAEEGPDMVILGSGSIVQQLTSAGVVDRYQIVVNPLVLGSGRTLFAGIADRVDLRLTGTRRFENGNVVLWYER